MVYCVNKTLLFIHIPRCGGTSIEKALNTGHGYGIKNGRAIQHYLWNDYYSTLGKRKFNQYYRFAVVRDPYTRFVSEYFWCEISKVTRVKDVGARVGQSMDAFIEYCEQVVKREYYYLTPYHDHIIPQHKFIYDSNNNLMIDKVFKFEKYNDAVSMLRQRYGIVVKCCASTKVNYDKSFSLSEYQKERIYSLYKKDFELLGYSK